MTTGASVFAVAKPVYHHSLVRLPVPFLREQIAKKSLAITTQISSQNILFASSHSSSSLPSWIDEFCRGRGNG